MVDATPAAKLVSNVATMVQALQDVRRTPKPALKVRFVEPER